MHAFKQLVCLAIVFAVISVSQVGAQDSSGEMPADIYAAWNRAKREYLVKIEASQTISQQSRVNERRFELKWQAMLASGASEQTLNWGIYWVDQTIAAQQHEGEF
jgi:hypothetical protein